MEKISEKLIEEYESVKSDNVLNLAEIRSIKDEISILTSDLEKKFKIDESDPSYRVYGLVQNLLSYFAENISVRDDCIEYYDVLEKDDEEYMPSYPPMSPITNSYYSYWCLLDYTFGLAKETMGSIFEDFFREMSSEKLILNTLENLNKSQMELYIHEGIEDGLVKLKNIATGESSLCLSPAGYLGNKNEIWFVRLVENLDSIYEYKIALTTPYIIVNSDESDWIQFYTRQSVIVKGKVDHQNYIKFMKTNPDEKYWHNFIMDGFANYEYNCIYLQGIPDVVGSKPCELKS